MKSAWLLRFGVSAQCFETMIHDVETFFLRRNHNRQRAFEQLEKLRDSLQLQSFVQDCDEVGG